MRQELYQLKSPHYAEQMKMLTSQDMSNTSGTPAKHPPTQYSWEAREILDERQRRQQQLMKLEEGMTTSPRENSPQGGGFFMTQSEQFDKEREKNKTDVENA